MAVRKKKVVEKKATRRPRTKVARAKRNATVSARPFRKGLSDKGAIEALYHAFKLNKDITTPELNLTLKDPAASFMIEVYEAIAKLGKKNLYQVIEELTGVPPDGLDEASMMGQLKRLFHSMFYEEPQNAELVLKYNSVWKMWPGIRRKPRKEKREMATAKKAPAKKAVAKKKTPTKVTPKKAKALSKKKASKKASAKKAPAKKTKAPKIDDKAVVLKVKGAKTPVLKIRQELVKSVPVKGKTYGDLVTEFGAGHVNGCLKKGFIKIK